MVNVKYLVYMYMYLKRSDHKVLVCKIRVSSFYVKLFKSCYQLNVEVCYY